MRRITWPAVGGLVVTLVAFAYFYLVLNSGHIGTWSRTWSNGGYEYHAGPGLRSTLLVASLVGLAAAGIAAVVPARRHPIILTAVIGAVVFAAFALLVVPAVMGPRI